MIMITYKYNYTRMYKTSLFILRTIIQHDYYYIILFVIHSFSRPICIHFFVNLIKYILHKMYGKINKNISVLYVNIFYILHLGFKYFSRGLKAS